MFRKGQESLGMSIYFCQDFFEIKTETEAGLVFLGKGQELVSFLKKNFMLLFLSSEFS
jgi:hypothetical protein